MDTKTKLVIFDLDGVLTDTAEFHYAAWKMLADDLGIYFDKKINERLKGISRLESLDIVLENADRKFTDKEKEEMAYNKNEQYKALLEDMTPDALLPGVLDTLNCLKENDIKIALASASKNAFTVISKLGIEGYFDYIVDVTKIKKGKPDPEIFFIAANTLGIDVQNCVGVEDSSAGVKAIKSAQMKAIGIGDKATLHEADVVVDGLVELMAIIA